MGRYGEALSAVQKIFSLEQVKDAPQYMAAFIMRGMVYRALLNYENALEVHLQAQEHIHRLGNPDMKRVLTAHITADYAALGQWDKAFEEAQIAMQTKDFGWYYAGFHYWAIIGGLLHGGEEKAAENDIARLEEAIGQYPRYQIIVERCKVVLKKWRGDTEKAIGHLEKALETAETHQGGALPPGDASLPGERWPVLVELAKLAEEMGDGETAASHRRRAREIVQSIAEQIEDVALREGFLGRTADIIG